MTVGLQNLSNLAFYSIKGIYPPLAEQEKIVSYLEGKTSKIDAYVAEKEKEILLLQELKQKTIADAVTKGLNPDVKMKDSGISWIGMIPEHWEIRKLSQVSYEHYISNKDVHHQNLLSLSYGRIIRKDTILGQLWMIRLSCFTFKGNTS
jgi:type I restriction enzyme S subunit